MRIEPASMDDLEAVVDAWVNLARDQQQHGSHILPGDNRDPIRMRLAGHVVDGTLLVARDTTRILGFAMFDIEEGAFKQDTTRGIVYNVYVTPDARNQGIGTALIDAAEDNLAAAGADVIALEVLADNDHARRLYRNLGYRPHRIEFEKAVESDTHTKEDG